MWNPNLFSLDIICGGLPLRRIEHEGQTFLEVPSTGNYLIRAVNGSADRILAVISVDGLSILDGEPASVERGGYVIEPWGSVTINGWHRTSQETAAFVFAPVLTGSYSAQMGKGTANVGVIGAAFFREKKREIRTSGGFYKGVQAEEVFGVRKSVTRSTQACSTLPQDVGTGYGEKLEMKTAVTQFTRASTTPDLVVQYRYATREVLTSWGVPVGAPPIPGAPSAFPQAPSVKAPPNWRG